MGFDAAIFVFDTTIFSDVIGPAWARSYAARRLLPELRTLMHQRGWGTSYLEQEEAETDQERYGWWLSWDKTCATPDNPRCTLVGARALAVTQGQLLEGGVWYYPYTQDVYFLCGRKQRPRLNELMETLNTRGWTTCCAACQNFAPVGVAGWLDPVETKEFAEQLDLLDLPRYAPSFEAMEAARNEASRASTRHLQLLSLSFMRTTAQIAASQGNGLLWGNDVEIGTYFGRLR